MSAYQLRTTIKCSGCKQEIQKAEKRRHDESSAARKANEVACHLCGRVVHHEWLIRHVMTASCVKGAEARAQFAIELRRERELLEREQAESQQPQQRQRAAEGDDDDDDDQQQLDSDEFSNTDFAFVNNDGPLSDDEFGGGGGEIADAALRGASPPLDGDGAVRFVAADVVDVAAATVDECRTESQATFVNDAFNRELALLLARLVLKREDIESLLRLLRKIKPDVMPSFHHYDRVLSSTLKLVDVKQVDVPRSGRRDVKTLSFRQPIDLIAALVDKYVDDGVDLGAMFNAQDAAHNTVPLAVQATPLYHGACGHLRHAIEAAFVPVFFEIYADEYHIDKQKRQACALRICLVADRSQMREVCTFSLDEFAVDDVLRAVIRPAVAQLERGVRVKCSSGAIVPICGSLYGALGDMMMRWGYLGLKQWHSVLSSTLAPQRWAAMRSGTVAVRDLRGLARAANAAHTKAQFAALGMHHGVPELLTPQQPAAIVDFPLPAVHHAPVVDRHCQGPHQGRRRCARLGRGASRQQAHRCGGVHRAQHSARAVQAALVAHHAHNQCRAGGAQRTGVRPRDARAAGAVDRIATVGQVHQVRHGARQLSGGRIAPEPCCRAGRKPERRRLGGSHAAVVAVVSHRVGKVSATCQVQCARP